MGLDVTVSGSYRKFAEEVGRTIDEFEQLGSRVLSPKSATVLASVDGFVSLRNDCIERIDRVAESGLPGAFQLVENGHLQAIRRSDVLWLVMPNGYLGVAASLELGWALAHEVPIYCALNEWVAAKEPMVRAYVEATPSIAHLVSGFVSKEAHHNPQIGRAIVETTARRLYGAEYNSSVAVGPLVVDKSDDEEDPRVLLVETYKWANRLSIPGERLQRGEGVASGLARVLREQTGLGGKQGGLVCAFDELPNGGYWQPNTHRLFVDWVVEADLRQRINLDYRASRAVVMPLSEVLVLPASQIEPNAQAAFQALKERAA